MTPDAEATDRSTPLGGESASFQTHKLVLVNDQLIEFRPTTGAYAFALVSFLFCAGVPLALLLVAVYEASWSFAMAAVASLGVGVAVGAAVIRDLQRRIAFDLVSQRFIKDARGFFDLWHEVGHDVPLADVSALQVLSVIAGPSGDEFPAHELNLILHNGSRVHVLGHADGASLYADAVRLGAVLGCPVRRSE